MTRLVQVAVAGDVTEAEQLMQYYKLHRKVAAGADYVITQLGFDARKFLDYVAHFESGIAQMWPPRFRRRG